MRCLKSTLILALLPGLMLWSVLAAGQCLSGDCQNGFGKYNFSYAMYTGQFRNGQPDGKGIMDYGKDGTYEGGFKNGAEDGAGILTKNGIKTSVFYRNGKIEAKAPVTVIAGNAPKIDGCTGNCWTGYGTMKFPSGNVYTGNFSGGQFNGKGRMAFSSGNVIDAVFMNHVPQNGTFFYAQENVHYKGTFDAEAHPLTGVYDYVNTGNIVDIKDGRVIATHNPKKEAEAKAKAEHDRSFMVCPACGGAGGESIAMSWKSSKKTYSGTIYDEFTTTTNYGPPVPHICLTCNGKGEIKKR